MTVWVLDRLSAFDDFRASQLAWVEKRSSCPWHMLEAHKEHNCPVQFVSITETQWTELLAWQAEILLALEYARNPPRGDIDENT